MSAHLIAMCRAAEGCPVSLTARTLRAGPSHAPDHYVPPAEDSGLVAFLSSTQAILGLAILLIATTLLLWQLWTDRRDKALEKEERKRAG